MMLIICTRDIYVTYQNRSEHKEGKKIKISQFPYAAKFDLSMICLSLTGEAHTSLKQGNIYSQARSRMCGYTFWKKKKKKEDRYG